MLVVVLLTPGSMCDANERSAVARRLLCPLARGCRMISSPSVSRQLFKNMTSWQQWRSSVQLPHVLELPLGCDWIRVLIVFFYYLTAKTLA